VIRHTGARSMSQILDRESGEMCQLLHTRAPHSRRQLFANVSHRGLRILGADNTRISASALSGHRLRARARAPSLTPPRAGGKGGGEIPALAAIAAQPAMTN
jgi:hypothetical protein